MKNTKIDWCDCTVNPVVGCSNNCKWCYARMLNTRFKWNPDFSKPMYFPQRLKEFEVKSGKSVFINSMSDISQWKGFALLELSNAILRNPQHQYIALTKNPALYQGKYIALQNKQYLIAGLDKLHLGVTITKAADFEKLGILSGASFLSLEPLLGAIDLLPILRQAKLLGQTIKAVILGAQTGYDKGKVYPQRVWIEAITKQADEHGIAVYMKGSLSKLMGLDLRQDLLPWQKAAEIKSEGVAAVDCASVHKGSINILR